MSTNALSRRSVLKGGLLSLLAGNCLRGSRAQANDLRVGEMAPPATLVTLDGQRIVSRDLTGSVVILTFWATWCAPCHEELPLLSRYATEHADDGLRVLGFSLDTPDELPLVRKIARTLTFPVGLLTNSSAPGYGRIWRLPVNFTIDRSGRLVEDGWKLRKPVWTAERLEQVVTPLLRSAS
ncbi:MAG TPA: TlpA disulfide reductase family protein [Steroidobacteraceae bacterium]|nr:TlpA disulfide reductase family protein [Steroidobacteraceae bacterium]